MSESKHSDSERVYHYTCGNEDVLSVELTIYKRKKDYLLRFKQIGGDLYSISTPYKEISRTTTCSLDSEGFNVQTIELIVETTFSEPPEKLFQTNAW